MNEVSVAGNDKEHTTVCRKFRAVYKTPFQLDHPGLCLTKSYRIQDLLLGKGGR